MRSLFTFAATISLLAAPCVWAQENGLFANIQTSAGLIRAQLEFEKAPLTVSNFVGLIEGSQTALNSKTGRLIQGDFYDGITFHRVIKDFMIQTGARTGDGRDGPGYTFQDEFHPDLTHDEPFVLSMANAGPSTNGSQFFITVRATPELNNVHSVFGKVVEGSEFAKAISEVETGPSDRPMTPVTIETISLERVGAAAEAFQPDIAGLPRVTLKQPKWNVVNKRYLLDVDFQRSSDYNIFISGDLQEWSNQSFGFFGETLPDSAADVTDIVNGQPQGFFRISEVQYPVILAPSEMNGKTLETFITEFNAPLNYTFTSVVTGSAKLSTRDPVSFSNYLYQIDGPATATLIVPSSLLPVPFDLTQYTLRFSSASTGTFVLSLPNGFPPGTVVSGPFTLNDS